MGRRGLLKEIAKQVLTSGSGLLNDEAGALRAGRLPDLEAAVLVDVVVTDRAARGSTPTSTVLRGNGRSSRSPRWSAEVITAVRRRTGLGLREARPRVSRPCLLAGPVNVNMINKEGRQSASQSKHPQCSKQASHSGSRTTAACDASQAGKKLDVFGETTDLSAVAWPCFPGRERWEEGQERVNDKTRDGC